MRSWSGAEIRESTTKEEEHEFGLEEKDSTEGAASKWTQSPKITPEEQKSDFGKELAIDSSGGSRLRKCIENARLKEICAISYSQLQRAETQFTDNLLLT